MKVKKLLISLTVVVMAIAIAISSNVYAASDADITTFVELNLTSDPTSGTEYGINYDETENGWTLITKIGTMDGSAYKRLYNAYCAYASIGFEAREDVTTAPEKYIDNYNKRYDNEEIGTVDLYSSNYKKILALADLFYLGESDNNDINNEEYKNYIEEIVKSYLAETDTNYSSRTGDDQQAYFDAWYSQRAITPEQVRAVQQLALWYFTNGQMDGMIVDDLNSLIYYRTVSNGNIYELNNDTVGSFQDQQAKFLLDYLITTAEANANNNIYGTNDVYLYLDDQADDEQPILLIKKGNKVFDLALRKFITEIKDASGNTISRPNREPVVIDNEGNTADLTGNVKSGEKTAKKEHSKDPITVKKGNRVVYTIRIYNEGEINGYAKEVTDYLPLGLSFVPADESTVNTNNGWEYDETTRKVTTTKLAETELTAASRDWTKFDAAGKDVYYTDLQIECMVNDNAKSNNLKNIAEITDSQGIHGEEDVDSDEGNVTTTSEYEPTHPTTGRGEEDDDDFEELRLNFDLALRKYITRVEDRNGNAVLTNADLGRTPSITETTITSGEGKLPTTATYNHRKYPVTVQTGYYVYYTLTVYNEGDADGYATQIKDQLPEGLQFVDVVSGDFEQYGTVTSDNILTLNRKSGLETQKAYVEGKLVDNSESVVIKCLVTGEDSKKILTNIAWISAYYNADEAKTVIEDVDSESTTPTVKPSKNELVTDDIGYTGGETKTAEELENNDFFRGQEDDDDFEKIIIENLDLALRKFIIEIKSGNTTINPTDREPQITGNNVITEPGGTTTEDTTAQKQHSKEPLEVSKGDKVTYKIRVYNEGYVDAFAAEVTDYLPLGLDFISKSESVINTNNGWEYDETTRKVTTNKLKENLLTASNGGWTKFNEDGKDIYYTDLLIECLVNEHATSKNLRNIAAITKYEDENGQEATDIDSEKTPVNPGEYNPQNKEDGIGEEDDDDLEELKLVELDLALRKFITGVATNADMTDVTTYYRAPVVSSTDIVKLYNGEITTAEYKHRKTPVKVNVGDYVEYTLRVYNEGSMDGYAREITDHLPEYLEFVDCETNTETYKWTVSSDGRTVTTDYLKDTKLNAVTSTILDSSNRHDKELKIICRVVDTIPYETYQTNIAEITKYGDKTNTPLDVDRDSQTIDNDDYNGLVDIPEDKDLPNYRGNDENKADLSDDNYHYKGQQDDDDFEKIYTPKFDLALRKFITKVEDVTNNKTREITNRVPELSIDETTGNIKYTHTKEPVNVVKDNIVTYTLRIFNEGNVDGYASVITDDIPDGVVFLPENETNVEYGWQMYTELADGIEVSDPSVIVELNVNGGSEVKKYVPTTDASKAVIIRTDYLSRENGLEKMEEGSTVNPNLIKAYTEPAEGETPNPDYKDIKVAFRVIEPNGSKRILTNYAQISNDQDEYGNPVKDIDSETDKWNEGEDDQDIENIRVPEFDLALRKWVTQAIVYENGEETVTNTNHDPWDDPEDVVKVELHRKKLSDVTVKFRYSIRVYNQGELEGYAKEVKDYIPEGLMFVQEDNPDWTLVGDNIITTTKLENTLLKPEEYVDVEVLLTWINGNDNLGLKTNTAEISKDYNEWGVPDKDSTPDNKEPKEDDIDIAEVMLSISTGEDRTVIIMSIGIGLAALITIAGGVFLIKKYVM